MAILKKWWSSPRYWRATTVLVLAIGSLSITSSGWNPDAEKWMPFRKSEADWLWKKIGPGGGGSTFIPTFSYHDPDKFLLRCDMTGSYLSSDGGLSYHQINFANGAFSFAFDPLDSNIVYVGSTALHRSVDGGKHWQQILPKKEEVKTSYYQGDHATFTIKTDGRAVYPKEEPLQAITHIRVDPSLTGHLYGSMGPYFLYSSDSGETWSGKMLDQSIAYLYTNPTHLQGQVYIFTASDLFVFNNRTQSLKKKPLPAAMTPAFSFTGGTSREGDVVIFYALSKQEASSTDNAFGQSSIWISETAGESWHPVQDSLFYHHDTFPSFSSLATAEFDARHAYVVCDRFLEEKEDGTTAHWYGCFKTSDGGKSWQWVWKGGGGSGQYGVRDGLGTANLQDAWVDEAFGGEYIRLIDVGVAPYEGQTAIVTDWYRTMKTVNGGQTWQEIYSAPQPGGGYTSRGLDVTTSYGVHFDPFDSNHMAISYTDIGYHHSFDGGKSWERSVEGVPEAWRNTCYWTVFDPAVKGKVWSAWSSLHDFPRGKMTREPDWKQRAKGGICVSVDGGRNWQASSEGMGLHAPTTSIVLDPDSKPGNRTLYACVFNQGVFKSTDDGQTWVRKNKGLEGNVSAFEVTLQSDGTLFLVVSPTPVHQHGQKGREVYFGAVYQSTDGAETWHKLTISEKALFPNGIGVDPKDPDRIYLACWSDIMLSDLVGGAVAATTGGNEILDFEGGIFASEDGGVTWQSIFDADQYVYDVTVDPYQAGRLYCNTFNQAAYRSDDYGKTWHRLPGYDFHWGHRVIIDPHQPSKVYLTTFGSSVWQGMPQVE